MTTPSSNGDYATRLDGKAMNSRLAELREKIQARLSGGNGESQSQVYNGTVAILTYNYVGLTQDKDEDNNRNRAKSNPRYVKKATMEFRPRKLWGGSTCQNNKL